MEKQTTTATSHHLRKRGYQMPWYGRSNIYYSGKLFTGPTSSLWPISVISSITLTTLAVWISSYKEIVVAGGYSHLFYTFIVLIGILLYNYWSCCFKDPGVIMRHPNYLQLEKEKKLRQKKEVEARYAKINHQHQQRLEAAGVPADSTSSSSSSSSSSPSGPQSSVSTTTTTANSTVEGSSSSNDQSQDKKDQFRTALSTDGVAHIYKKRHCQTCYIDRPPLASHCGECDQCVKNFDHHCAFVNNCIGRRNMRNFVMFLNLCAICSSMFIFGYFGAILPGLAAEHNISDDDMFSLKLNLLGVLVAGSISAAYHPFVVVSAPYAIKMLQHYNRTFYGKNLTWECYQLLNMFITTVILCLSFPLAMMYLHLNFQGFTRKEKKVVEETQKTKVQTVNLIKGLSNLLKFYFECEHVPSEFDKFVGEDIDHEDEEASTLHNCSHEYEHVQSNETTEMA